MTGRSKVPLNCFLKSAAYPVLGLSPLPPKFPSLARVPTELSVTERMTMQKVEIIVVPQSMAEVPVSIAIDPGCRSPPGDVNTMQVLYKDYIS